MSETFSNGSLSRSWFTDQYWIVLGTTRQNLQYSSDLIITTNHRVEFASTGFLAEVDGILIKCLLLFLILILILIIVHNAID